MICIQVFFINGAVVSDVDMEKWFELRVFAVVVGPVEGAYDFIVF